MERHIKKADSKEETQEREEERHAAALRVLLQGMSPGVAMTTATK